MQYFHRTIAYAEILVGPRTNAPKKLVGKLVIRTKLFGEAPLLSRAISVPTCPKCGKSISAQRYARHLRRCGTTHKRGPQTLDHPDNFWMKI